MHATIYVLSHTPYVPELFSSVGAVPYHFDYAKWKPGGLSRLLWQLGRLPDAETLARRLQTVEEAQFRAKGNLFIIACSFIASAGGQETDSINPIALGAALPVCALGDSPGEVAETLLLIVREGLKRRRAEVEYLFEKHEVLTSAYDFLRASGDALYALCCAAQAVRGALVPGVGFYDWNGVLGYTYRDLDSLRPDDVVKAIEEVKGYWIIAVDVHV